jgi:hypothetical protein
LAENKKEAPQCRSADGAKAKGETGRMARFDSDSTAPGTRDFALAALAIAGPANGRPCFRVFNIFPSFQQCQKVFNIRSMGFPPTPPFHVNVAARVNMSGMGFGLFLFGMVWYDCLTEKKMVGFNCVFAS